MASEFNPAALHGRPSTEAADMICREIRARRCGSFSDRYKLKDWLISRQRCWGTPIPIVHCPACGAVPVPEEELPVELPKDAGASGRGSSLAAFGAWRATSCPRCHAAAERDPDTMDTFVDSAWYFMCFPRPYPAARMFSPDTPPPFGPVDIYVGGIENSIMHLLYARFITMFLADQGLVSFSEPFTKLITQGMVTGRTFKCPDTGLYLKPHEVELGVDEAVVKKTGRPAVVLAEKMSKSKHNGVDPQKMLADHGIDVVRLYMLFKAPPEMALEWDVRGIVGHRRWLARVWTMVSEFLASSVAARPHSPALEETLDAAVVQVTRALCESRHAFNVAIAHLMKLSNHLATHEHKDSEQFGDALKTFSILLYPMAPHFAAETFASVSSRLTSAPADGFDVASQPWPSADHGRSEGRPRGVQAPGDGVGQRPGRGASTCAAETLSASQ